MQYAVSKNNLKIYKKKGHFQVKMSLNFKSFTNPWPCLKYSGKNWKKVNQNVIDNLF